MIIENNKVVTIEYTLKNDKGTILDQTDDSFFSYLHGNGNIITGLEKALEGKKVGDTFTTVVKPEEGYGIRNEEVVFDIPKDTLASIPDIQLGSQFQAKTDDGIHILTIVGIHDKTYTVDGNHPLAGQTLHFAGSVKEIRDPSKEEIEHGHVHKHGHDH